MLFFSLDWLLLCLFDSTPVAAEGTSIIPSLLPFFIWYSLIHISKQKCQYLTGMMPDCCYKGENGVKLQGEAWTWNTLTKAVRSCGKSSKAPLSSCKCINPICNLDQMVSLLEDEQTLKCGCCSSALELLEPVAAARLATWSWWIPES